MKGAYILIFRCKKETKINVGSLDTIHFKKGFYVYVGSAMNDLLSRVRRHFNVSKETSHKRKWHVDYLLTSQDFELVASVLFPSINKIECKVSRFFESNATTTVKKFGSTDCSKCKGHLHYFPSLKEIFNVLEALNHW